MTSVPPSDPRTSQPSGGVVQGVGTAAASSVSCGCGGGIRFLWEHTEPLPQVYTRLWPLGRDAREPCQNEYSYLTFPSGAFEPRPLCGKEFCLKSIVFPQACLPWLTENRMHPIFPMKKFLNCIMTNNGYCICYVVGAVMSMQCPITLTEAQRGRKLRISPVHHHRA